MPKVECSLLAGGLRVFYRGNTPENAEFAITGAILDARENQSGASDKARGRWHSSQTDFRTCPRWRWWSRTPRFPGFSPDKNALKPPANKLKVEWSGELWAPAKRSHECEDLITSVVFRARVSRFLIPPPPPPLATATQAIIWNKESLSPLRFFLGGGGRSRHFCPFLRRKTSSCHLKCI